MSEPHASQSWASFTPAVAALLGPLSQERAQAPVCRAALTSESVLLALPSGSVLLACRSQPHSQHQPCACPGRIAQLWTGFRQLPASAQRGQQELQQTADVAFEARLVTQRLREASLCRRPQHSQVLPTGWLVSPHARPMHPATAFMCRLAAAAAASARSCLTKLC